MRIPKTIVSSVILSLLSLAATASPFATAVINYSPGPSQYERLEDPDERAYYMGLFMDKSKAIGAPCGGLDNTTTSVVTLGDGGSITLAFDHDVVDDPANPGGYDFIVFGNTIAGWQEPAFVEISKDGMHWFLLPPSPSVANLVIPSVVLRNYAEYTPTLELPAFRSVDEFYTFPDRQSRAGNPDLLQTDVTSGGGDAFDIAEAVYESAPGVPLPIPAGISSFRQIRITDAKREGVHPIFGDISADIDAVADVAPAVSVGSARRLQNGSYAAIWTAKVTAVIPDEGFYIEQPDRSAGMKVISTIAVSEGDSIAVTGHVNSQNITDSLVTVLDHGSNVSPVGISGRAAKTDLLTGMLVKVWGKKKQTGDGYVTIDDGSGATITVDYSSLEVSSSNAALVVATGILTRRSSGEVIVRVTKASDISM